VEIDAGSDFAAFEKVRELILLTPVDWLDPANDHIVLGVGNKR